MSYLLDFEQIKVSNPIEDVARRLGLNLVKSGASLRCKCPVCESTGDRNLAITPGKNLFYCFTWGKGGDVLQLVAHVKGISIKEAAEFLAGKPAGNTPKEKAKEEKSGEGFKSLEYLVFDHAAVSALGLEPDDAQRLGIGYCPRGIYKGKVAIPVRLATGHLCGYLAVEEVQLPPKWNY